MRKDGIIDRYTSFTYPSIQLLSNHLLSTCHVPEAKTIEVNKARSWFSWSSKSRVGSGVQEPALTHLPELLVKFLRIL